MMPERFIAGTSKLKSIGLPLLGLAFVVGCVWMAIDPVGTWRAPAINMRIFGMVGGLFFTAATIIWFRRLGQSGPVIEIGSEGVRWSRWSDSVIPWASIERSAVRSISGQRFLALWLQDPTAYPPSTFEGRTQVFNKALGFGDISLSTGGTDRGFDELIKAVETFAPGVIRP